MTPEILRETAHMVQIEADYATDYDERCYLHDLSEQIHQDADAAIAARDGEVSS